MVTYLLGLNTSIERF